MNKDVFIKLVWLLRVLHQVVRGREKVTEVRYSSLFHKQSVLSGLKQENMGISSNSLKETFKVKFNMYDNSFQVCFLLFFKRSTFVGSARSFVFFIPVTTANDLRLRRISIPDLILILEKEPVFPFSMLSAKQGNYWYHFYNVFGMTRSLTGDWTRDLPHYKMTMETIIFLLNHMLTYCITVDLENIVLKCKYRVCIEQLFDRKSLLSS